MRPSRAQQALAALAVLFVVAVTILGGIFLTLSDNPATPIAEQPTATPYRFPTLEVTDTPLPMSGETPMPTSTPVLPSSTPSPTPQPTVTFTPTPCQIASGWVAYVVQPGDTLFTVGLRYNITTDRLRAGNCLSSDTLFTGQVIYVPPLPPTLPAASPLPAQATLTTTLPLGYDGICADMRSVITSPPVGATLSGVVQFYGTAAHPDFQFYKLEIRQEGASTSADFITFVTRYEPVVNGLLGELNTAAFGDGEYWIRLVVVDHTGNYPERCSILYTIDN